MTLFGYCMFYIAVDLYIMLHIMPLVYRNDIRNNLILLVFALVDFHVGSQVGSVCKLFTTMSTSIGFLASVRSHVSL